MIKPLLLILTLATATGCTLLESPYFWRITVSSVLRSAYESGGAEAVEYKINALTHQGIIDPEQAQQLKAAAQKGYEKILDKLHNLNLADIPIE